MAASTVIISLAWLRRERPGDDLCHLSVGVRESKLGRTWYSMFGEELEKLCWWIVALQEGWGISFS